MCAVRESEFTFLSPSSRECDDAVLVIEQLDGSPSPSHRLLLFGLCARPQTPPSLGVVEELRRRKNLEPLRLPLLLTSLI